MTTPQIFRVGIVPYLNMLPLTYGMEDLKLKGKDAPHLRIVSAPPSRMVRMMERGEIDLGMAPVGALPEHPDWRIVGQSMIGSRGPVRSVVILSRDPPERWTRLHPDSHSRTSNLLAQILLARRFGARPRLGKTIPLRNWKPPLRPAPGEAFLLIGTRALRWHDHWRGQGGTTLDLGQLWTDWTGLPFVYAVWVLRSGIDPEKIRLNEWLREFEKLKKHNLARLNRIIPAWPGLREENLTPQEARNYLTRNIIFDFDASARRGLNRFLSEAGRASFV